MNDSRSIRQTIANICDMLQGLGVVRDVNWPIIMPDFNSERVEPRRPDLPASYMLSESMFDVYKTMLGHRDYTILFWDGGVLQMAYWVNGEAMLKHRLLYQMPVLRLEDVPEGEDPAEILERLLPEELVKRARPCAALRFDYDPSAERPGHAASHLTIVGDECRIPVTHPLAPAQFVKFIIRHYYPKVWAQHARVRAMHETRYELCIVEDDGRDMHISCGTD